MTEEVEEEVRRNIRAKQFIQQYVNAFDSEWRDRVRFFWPRGAGTNTEYKTLYRALKELDLAVVLGPEDGEVWTPETANRLVECIAERSPFASEGAVVYEDGTGIIRFEFGEKQYRSIHLLRYVTWRRRTYVKDEHGFVALASPYRGWLVLHDRNLTSWRYPKQIREKLVSKRNREQKTESPKRTRDTDGDHKTRDPPPPPKN